MPRRPRKQPRASNGIKAEKQGPKAFRQADGKMKKWVRREDVQGNEEDECTLFLRLCVCEESMILIFSS